MDALFGLPRKKSAGISHRDPLHGTLFFGDQAAVDEYVAAYKMPRKTIPKVSLLNKLRKCEYNLNNASVVRKELIYYHVSRLHVS